MSKNPMEILNKLMKPVGPYELKGVGSPEYYLGGDLKIKYKNNVISKMVVNARTYVEQITKKIETLMEWTLRGYMQPGDPNYCWRWSKL